MSDFHSVVTEQKVYICSVYSFIVRLLQAVLPEVAWNSALLLSEDSLAALLEGVIRKNALEGANEGDCRLAMAQVACNSMKRLCDLLKRISESVGLKDVAERYLDAPWFIDMLYRKDTSKLNKLLYTIDFTDDKPSRILMNVAAILNDKAVAYDGMSARAKRKADKETKELIREVGARMEKKLDTAKDEVVEKIAAMRDELHETKEQLIAKADEMLRKIVKERIVSKKSRTHTIEQKKVCLALWMEAQRNEELKSGTESGRATYEAAFNWYKRRLALVEIDTAAKFIAVMRTINNTNSAESIKALEAKREAERKAKKNNPQTSTRNSQLSPLNTKKPKCGIIRAMKKRGRKALAVMTAAIVGGMGACLASDAFECDILTPPPHCYDASCELPERVCGNTIACHLGRPFESSSPATESFSCDPVQFNIGRAK